MRSAELYAPSGFTRHVVELGEGAYCPCAQATQLPLPARYVPAAHGTHCVESADAREPDAHGVHDTALAPDMEPTAQLWHVCVEVLTNVPAEQDVYDVRSLVAYAPAGTRRQLVELGDGAYVPGLHKRHVPLPAR